MYIIYVYIMHTHFGLGVYVRMYVCMYVCMYVYICICVYVYVYIDMYESMIRRMSLEAQDLQRGNAAVWSGLMTSTPARTGPLP